MGIKTSPYQNGDPRIGLGIVQSLTHTNMGFIPIWGPTELIPKLERHSKWGPHIGMGIPISVWVGICQYSKSGSQYGAHSNLGTNRYIGGGGDEHRAEALRVLGVFVSGHKFYRKLTKCGHLEVKTFLVVSLILSLL
jgi:hypothetical protein